MTTNEILDRVSAVLNAPRVFISPAKKDGLTIIPAANVRGGGGGGAQVENGRQGDGGGFGVYAHARALVK